MLFSGVQENATRSSLLFVSGLLMLVPSVYFIVFSCQMEPLMIKLIIALCA